MPATHSFSLTPKASKIVKFNKYPRYLGGASKMVSNAIEFYYSPRTYVTGPAKPSDEFDQDPVTLACVNCGATHPRREIHNIGEIMDNIQALQEHLSQAYEEIEELKNRKIREIIWQRISGSE